MVFWQAGSCCGIAADTPCIVMVQEVAGEVKIAVSEPTQKEAAVRLHLDKAVDIQKADPRIAVSVEAGKTTLTFDFSDAQGATLCGTFSTEE